MTEETHGFKELLFNKVPQVTLLFWIIKMMSTTVGETGADFLNFNLGFGLTATSVITGLLLAVFLVEQIRSSRYIPWLYWSTVLLISVFGTLITDNLTDQLNVPLKISTGVFSALLVMIFAAWYKVENTLSIHSIFTTRREMFYWSAILVTFALGTAAGDLLAEDMGIGYGHAVLLFGALIAVIAFSHFILKAGAILTFWIAYVLTRPLGASLGDFLSQPTSNGGLGLGTSFVNAFFLLTIVVLVGYLTICQNRKLRIQT